MHLENPEALRQWLTNALEPICDADPGALAKYVMALLKKDKGDAELQEFCIDQLDVFLQKETKSFVENLFDVVKDNSYLPQTQQQQSSGAVQKKDSVTSGSEIAKQQPLSATGANTSGGLESTKRKPQISTIEQPAKIVSSSGNSGLNAQLSTKDQKEAVVSSNKHPIVAPSTTTTVVVATSSTADNLTGRGSRQPASSGASGKTTREVRRSRSRSRDRRRARGGVGGGSATSSGAPKAESTTTGLSSRIQRDRHRLPERTSGGSLTRGGRLATGANTISVSPGHRPIVDSSTGSGKLKDTVSTAKPQESTRRAVHRHGHYSRSRSPVSPTVPPRHHQSQTPPPRGARKRRVASRTPPPQRSRSATPTPSPPSGGGGRTEWTRRTVIDDSSSESVGGREVILKKRKQRCRDYDEKGYCMQGDMCPFDHGPDPVVVDDSTLPGMLQIGGSGGAAAKRPPATGAGGAAQHQPPASVVVAPPPNFSVPPPGYNLLNPPPPGVETPFSATAAVRQQTGTTGATGSSTAEGYNPESPALTSSASYTVPPPPPNLNQPPPMGRWAMGRPPFSGPPPMQPMAPTVQMVPIQRPAMGRGIENEYPAGGGFKRGGRGAGGALSRLGGATGRPMGAQQQLRDNKTLEVRKIPPHLNNISKLNEHFAKFGQINNIHVKYEEDPEAALITYQQRHEAMTAYKSTEPILNNRFIKVFWHGGNANQPGQQSSVMDRLGHGEHIQAKPQWDPAQMVKVNVVSGGAAGIARGGGAVAFGGRGGSLSRTVYNPEALAKQKTAVNIDAKNGTTGSMIALTRTIDNTAGEQTPKQLTAMHDKVLSPSRPLQSKEDYIAIRKRRKLDKQRKLALIDLQKRKGELLSKSLKHQKNIISQLEKCKDPERKKQLVKMLKSLSKSVQTTKEELDGITQKLTLLAKPPDVVSKADDGTENAAAGGRTTQQVERERLDVEMELVNQKQAGGDTSDLQRRLGQLRHELTTSTTVATAIGQEAAAGGVKRALPTVVAAAVGVKKPRSSVIPQTAMLDKRPRNLTVTGFSLDERDAIITHMQQFGDLEDLEIDLKDKKNPKALVVYKTRKDAEQARALASDFEERQIQVDWVSAPRRLVVSDDAIDGAEGVASGGSATVVSAGVVPDGRRQPHQQVSAASLLASLDDDESSDDHKSKKDSDEDDDYEDDGSFVDLM